MHNQRFFFAAASGILGVLVTVATAFAWTLGSQCGIGPSIGWAIALAAIFFPITLTLAAISGLAGYYAQRRAAAILGCLLAIALAVSGVFALLPAHSWSLGMPCGIAI